jgi:hypothetical protein
MAVEDRIESLRRKHAALDQRIQAESSRPYPNDMLLKQLKFQKLQAKDQMQSLS